MERRTSSRIVAKKAPKQQSDADCANKAAGQDETNDVDTYAEENEEENDEADDDEESKKPRRKKRKGVTGKIGGQPPTKKMRGQRGKLLGMLDFPAELSLEIFANLTPLDLFNFASASMEFYIFVNSLNDFANNPWTVARANVPSLPPRPLDMTEFAYARLMFVKICHSCNRNVSVIHAVWSMRSRLCTKCLQAEFLPESYTIYRRNYPYELCSYVPQYSLTHKSGRYTKHTVYHNARIIASWEEQYKNSDDRHRWMLEKVSKWKARKQDAHIYETWLENAAREVKEERISNIEERKAIIVSHLKTLGWEEEMSNLNGTETRPQDLHVVSRACLRKFTEKTIQDLESQLVQHMEDVKQRRLQREGEVKIRERAASLEKAFLAYVTSYVPCNIPCPSLADVYSFPQVKSLIHDPPVEEQVPLHRFEELPFSEIVSQWSKAKQDELVDIISAACGPEYTFNRENVLQLATISFLCDANDHYAYHEYKYRFHDHQRQAYPQVLMHKCATAVKRLGVQLSVTENSLGSKCWNADGKMKFNIDGFKTVSELVKMCGLDPMTTTRAQMNDLNPIFECLKCSDRYHGRATMTWERADIHVRSEADHNVANLQFALLSDNDTEIARARLVEMKERDAAWNPALICVHCRKKFSTVGYSNHIKEHNIKQYTDNDFVLNVDHTHAPDVFWLWPPPLSESRTSVQIK